MSRQDILYLIVAIALGLSALGTVAGGVYLAAYDKAIPSELIALGSTSIGALASLLVPAVGQKQQ